MWTLVLFGMVGSGGGHSKSGIDSEIVEKETCSAYCRCKTHDSSCICPKVLGMPHAALCALMMHASRQCVLDVACRAEKLDHPLTHDVAPLALRQSSDCMWSQVCGAFDIDFGAHGCGDLAGECAAGVAKPLVEDCVLVRL